MLPPDNRRKVREQLEQIAKRAALHHEILNHPGLVPETAAHMLHICDGDASAALELLTAEALRSGVKAAQLAAAIEDFQRKIREQPVPMLVLSRPFDYGLNGSTRKVIYAARPGGNGMGAVVCVALADGQSPPQLFQWIFTDVEGKMWLAEAPPIPEQLEEHVVLRTKPQSSVIPELAQVVVSDGTDHGKFLFAEPALAAEIGARVDRGEQVKVEHNGIRVYGVTNTKLTQYEDWIEFPPREGQTLAEMFFPRALVEEWELDVEAMIRGEQLMVICQGPTGTGKTSGVIAAARTAALRSGKKFVIINVSPATVSSEWYGVTERTIRLALNRGKALAQEGYIAVVLLDEMNALLGGTGVRYEGNVDQRVRLTMQSLFSEDLKGVAVYGTMNVTRLDWLPPPLARRFAKRAFPRTAKAQLAGAAAAIPQPEVLAQVGLTPHEFGQRLGDFVFSNTFVIWTAHMQSGAVVPVRARDLHECSIGKIKSLIRIWERQVRYGRADSLQPLWARIAAEFSSVQLNEHNLFDSTFLRRPPHDTVRLVEAVRHVKDTVCTEPATVA